MLVRAVVLFAFASDGGRALTLILLIKQQQWSDLLHTACTLFHGTGDRRRTTAVPDDGKCGKKASPPHLEGVQYRFSFLFSSSRVFVMLEIFLFLAVN